MLLNADLIPEATFFIPAVAPNAMSATTNAYSTMS
jgi:hypothetical protein